MRPRLINEDGTPLTDEQRHARRCEQKARSYAKRCGEDPTYRQRQTEAARVRHVAAHGPRNKADLTGWTTEQRQERKKALQRAIRAQRKDDPAYRARVRQREAAPERVTYKGQWQREHAADLNARRRAARLDNPEHFRALESAAKKRRRERKKAAKKA